MQSKRNMARKLVVGLMGTGAVLGLGFAETQRTTAQPKSATPRRDGALEARGSQSLPQSLQAGVVVKAEIENGELSQFAPLTFSGRGELQLALGDLLFVPEEQAPKTLIGLPVLFDSEGRPTQSDAKDELSIKNARIELQFDSKNEVLAIVAHGDDGTVIEREFDVFRARDMNGAAFSTIVKSYFAYLSGGTFVNPSDDKQTADGGDGGGPPPEISTNSCNCSTTSCSASQDCPNNQTCKCSCRGADCHCWCSGNSA